MEEQNTKQKLEQLLNELKDYIKELSPVIRDEWNVCKEGVKSDFLEQLENFDSIVEKLSRESDNIIYEKFDTIGTPALIAIIKEHKVEGSNECYVWKKQIENKLFLYISYGKDQNLITKENNLFIVLQADSLSEDLQNMFEESELVILK